jgi:predicted butyrate kinase (DUF1464 family)
MPRVIGIDPGTVTVDLCGLDDGQLFLDDSLPTSDALRSPETFIARLRAAGPLDLIAGPSGYGLPCVSARDLTERDLRLAFLAAEGEPGGIGGLRTLVRALAASGLPVLFTPGVIHLVSVPPHRKVNRVDMGTADKLCAAVLAVREQATRRQCAFEDTSFILLELGGAFSAGIAVDNGRIVDGVGGSSGPMGFRASGALDGEVAYLSGQIPKSMIFTGGAAAIGGVADIASLADDHSARARLAFEAYLENAVKAVASLRVSAPAAREIILSGRSSLNTRVRQELERRIADATGLPLAGFDGMAARAGQAAQGAALLADGLAGGAAAVLVDQLGIRNARGTVLDHLYVMSRSQAESRLGL